MTNAADSPKEYDLGTTKNPLVVGPNVTTNSDLRIFSSDGNATMKAWVVSVCGQIISIDRILQVPRFPAYICRCLPITVHPSDQHRALERCPD